MYLSFITKYISVLRSGKLIAKEFKCICGNYMKEILTEDHKGMPTIIRNESSKWFIRFLYWFSYLLNYLNIGKK